jgi:hypothetical protein
MYEQLQEMADKLVYPIYPEKPELSSTTPTEEELKDYVSKLASYDSDIIEYDWLSKLQREQEEEIFEFIKQSAGLFDIPEQYRNKVWSKALEKGSYFEVNQELDKLTDLFF